MSRFSVKTFLSQAKRQLQQASKTDATTAFVVGNESADLDSIASALVYGYIQSSHPEARRSNIVTIPLTNIPARDLALRPELTTLLSHANLLPSDLITLDDLPQDLPTNKTSWTLVDHNALTGTLATTYSNPNTNGTSSILTGCIDHHDDESFIPATASPRLITKAGSCASLIANHLHDPWVQLALFSSSIGAANGQQSYLVIDDTAYTSTWDAQAALLALGAILIDTQNLTSAHKVTPHDERAVRSLEAFINMSPKLGPKYDREAFYSRLDAAKSDISSLSLTDILRKDYKSWTDGGLELGVASVVQGLEFLRGKAGAEADQGGKDSLVRACGEFAKERGLGLFAVMTAFTNGKGDFERELLLVSMEEGKATEAAERFVEKAKGKLELADLKEGSGEEKDGGVVWLGVWRQDNLEASRKRVGPLLREAMRG
jgi:exopolyphosphatase